MNLGIIGSRSFNDYDLLVSTIAGHFNLIDSGGNAVLMFSTIVSGGANGADKLGAKFAKERGIKLVEYLPDWSIGRHAGFLRNQQIIDASDFVLAFWDGVSRGTQNSLDLAKEQKKPTLIIYF